MTAAHWMAGVGWALVIGLWFMLKATVEHSNQSVAIWRQCAEIAIDAIHHQERSRREELKRREWACLALLARQHRDGKHDSEDFRTCARCREVAAEVGVGKA